MKIIRKDLVRLTKSVIRENASNSDWTKLVDRARNKTAYTFYCMPLMTVWKNKFTVETKTGNRFEFQLIK